MELGDSTTASELAALQARLVNRMTNEPSSCFELFAEIARRAHSVGSATQEATALLNQAGCAFYMGRYDTMYELSVVALEVCRQARVPLLESRALNSLGLVHQRRGGVDRAIRLFLDSLRLSSENGDDVGVARALGNIALLHVALGEHDVALRLYQQALCIARRTGPAANVANLLACIHEAYFALERYEQALRLADEVVGYCIDHDLARYECTARATHTRTLLRLDRVPAALRMACSGERVAKWSQDEEEICRFTWLQGVALMRLGRHEAAGERLRRALAAARGLGHAAYELHALEHLATWHENAGDSDAAAQCHQEAMSRRLKVSVRVSDPTLEPRPHAEAGQVASALIWRSELYELTHELPRAKHEFGAVDAHLDPISGGMVRAEFQAQVQRSLDYLSPDDFIGVVCLDVVRLLDGDVSGDETATSMVFSALGRRLEGVTRPGDFIGRLGHNEFAVCLQHMAHPDDVDVVGGRMREALSGEYDVRGVGITLDVRCRTVVGRSDGTSATALLRL